MVRERMDKQWHNDVKQMNDMKRFMAKANNLYDRTCVLKRVLNDISVGKRRRQNKQ